MNISIIELKKIYGGKKVPKTTESLEVKSVRNCWRFMENLIMLLPLGSHRR